MPEDDRIPAVPTPGQAEGEREPGEEGPIAPRTPGKAEGERDQRQEKKK